MCVYVFNTRRANGNSPWRVASTGLKPMIVSSNPRFAHVLRFVIAIPRGFHRCGKCLGQATLWSFLSYSSHTSCDNWNSVHSNLTHSPFQTHLSTNKLTHANPPNSVTYTVVWLYDCWKASRERLRGLDEHRFKQHFKYVMKGRWKTELVAWLRRFAKPASTTKELTN